MKVFDEFGNFLGFLGDLNSNLTGGSSGVEALALITIQLAVTMFFYMGVLFVAPLYMLVYSGPLGWLWIISLLSLLITGQKALKLFFLAISNKEFLETQKVVFRGIAITVTSAILAAINTAFWFSLNGPNIVNSIKFEQDIVANNLMVFLSLLAPQIGVIGIGLLVLLNFYLGYFLIYVTVRYLQEKIT